MTTVNLVDKLPIQNTRRTREGFLVATPRVARTGIQVYTGDELGIEHLKGSNVRVYRPEDEVFSQDAIKSYAHRPVTLGHPSQMVNADNWKEHSVGQTGEEIMRDGDFVRIPMVVMDSQAIASIESGVHELSMGYEAQIELTDGITPSGERYDAIQRGMRMNHLAIVPRARGGSFLRIGDFQEDGDMADNAIKTRTVLVDGLPVETTEAGAVVIEKLSADVKALKDAAEAASTAHSAALAAKDAEIASLSGKVLTAEAFDAKVREHVDLVSKAKLLVPAGNFDGLDANGVRKAVVAKLFGDSAVVGKDDTYVKVRFDIAVEDAAKGKGIDPLRGLQPPKMQVDSNGLTAADVSYQKMVDRLENAHAKKEG